MSYSLGIDVGPTSVAAAIARTSSAAEMISLGGNGAMVAPAVVALRADGTVATGEAAENGAHGVGRELMSRLGDPAPVVLGGAPYAVTDVLGALLRDVVDKVTAAQGESPDHIVLTRPAGWGPFRCALLEEAARRAGLTKPALVTEPEAAAAYYAATQGWHDGDTIAVYDLDDGTVNATVLRKQSGRGQILGRPERLEGLGDDDVPESIESTITALSGTLQSAQVEPADLSAVLLVGGSSGIPSAAQAVSARLGRPVVVDPHPEHVVALGAATLAAQSAHLHRPAQHRPAAVPAATPATPASAAPQAPTLPDAPLSIPAHRAAPAAAPTEDAPSESAAGESTVGENALNESVPSGRTVGKSALNETAATEAAATDNAPNESAPSDNVIRRDTVTVQSSAARKPQTALHPIRSLLPASDQQRSKAGQPASTARRRPPPRVLIGAGAAVALIGLIVLVVLGGRTGTEAPAPPRAEPSTVAKIGAQLATPAVGATIRVQATPTFVAVSPDGRHAYTANRDARVVTVVDTAVNEVTATIPIAAGPPRFLSFAPDGRTLYVSIFNDQGTIEAIDVLDTRSNTVVATIPQSARPYLPEVTPDGKQLYVPNQDDASISVIDTATNKVAGQIPIAPDPRWVAFSPDGQRAFAASHESNLVSVIETRNLEVETTIPVGNSPHSIAVNPHRPLAAVVNDNSNSVSIIDTAGQQAMATIPVGKDPQQLVWSPDGRFAYVANKGSNTVSVIDSETNQVTATVPTGAGPTSIAMTPDGRRAYVSNLGGATLTVLELVN
ncbi:MAG: beta-propeller fold lactonase family protein [Pseudonocardiaceae bacterium]